MKKAVVFCSGGMDSFCHLHWAIQKWGKENVVALFVDFNYSYVLKEFAVAQEICCALQVPLVVRSFDLHEQEDLKSHHLQMRNVFLLLLGSYYANNVVFGMLHNELSEDKNPRFVKRMQGLLDSQYVGNLYHQGRSLKIQVPFARYTKTQMVSWFLKNNGDKELLLKTVGCYSATQGQCGNCLSCFNRWLALENNGLKEKEPYSVQHPIDWLRKEFIQATTRKSDDRASLGLIWKKLRYVREIHAAFKAYGCAHPVLLYWKYYQQARRIK